LRVVALVKSLSLVFHSVTAKNAAELADTAAMFVVVRAKSNLEIPNGNARARFSASDRSAANHFPIRTNTDAGADRRCLSGAWVTRLTGAKRITT